MSKKYGDLYQRGYLDGDSELIYEYSPADIKAIVDRRWNQADDTERRLLVQIMRVIPCNGWFKYIEKAEKGEIPGGDLLLNYRDDLDDIATEGVARDDVAMNQGSVMYLAQVIALTEYIEYLTNKVVD